MVSLIANYELKKSLNNIKKPRIWADAGEELGLWVDYDGGKGAHYCVIRDPKYRPDTTDNKSVIALVQKDLRKDVNESIFKHLRKFGIAENDIWRALGKL